MFEREPFISFDVPEGSDAVVSAILDAHVQYESLRSLRLSWVHVLAVLGGVMTVTIAFPDAAPSWLNANLPLAWALCCVGTIATAIREGVWSRRRSRLLAERRPAGDWESRTGAS
jgi:hypothetical protein